jgi:hypothetical protein
LAAQFHANSAWGFACTDVPHQMPHRKVQSSVSPLDVRNPPGAPALTQADGQSASLDGAVAPNKNGCATFERRCIDALRVNADDCN